MACRIAWQRSGVRGGDEKNGRRRPQSIAGVGGDGGFRLGGRDNRTPCRSPLFSSKHRAVVAKKLRDSVPGSDWFPIREAGELPNFRTFRCHK